MNFIPVIGSFADSPFWDYVGAFYGKVGWGGFALVCVVLILIFVVVSIPDLIEVFKSGKGE